MAKKEKPEKESPQPKQEPVKRRVPAVTSNLNMYIYGNYGVEKDSKANVFYLGERWIGAEWLCPGLFDEMLLKHSEELKKLSGDREKLQKKILEIFKQDYLMLLWSRFNSIKDIVTDYVSEKVNTQEWDVLVKEAEEKPDEKKTIEFSHK